MSGVPPETSPQTPETGAGASNLFLRVVAAMVLAPLTIGIAWIGGWPWICLVTAAGALLYAEWLMIVGASRNRFLVAAGVSALVIAGLPMVAGRTDVAVAILVAGTAVVAIFASKQRLWVAGGMVYAAAAVIASILVRLDAEAGFLALMFVLLVVWVTDIGGYFAGRGIGGPKLWPRVSPKKTWAGAIGGLVLSLAVAAAFALLGYGRMLPLLLLGTMLSVVSQLGDLFESAIKRQFGVKDSSHIIPGHGGLMDRLDGFVAAIVFAAFIGFLRGGLDGVGRGFMVW
ncbi:phosphatidate cytidylyltransferase [Bradyrhizobium sp. G127]|uniref:phosphatidate cytidylyltransferase n=1 Tax=Bradyrhizobium sp. G127 TaxID=2904800 RepID=UPI001F3FC2EA|nr:phosphatidate cytidylyltransferase [Bradyrhizobium sp. G127]